MISIYYARTAHLPHMPAKDIYHDVVRTALEKDGWAITADPLTLKIGRRSYRILVCYPLFQQPTKLCRDVPAERLYD